MSEEMAPELGGEQSERALTGHEPLLARPNWKRLGKRQRSMLHYLSRQGGTVRYTRCWLWMAVYDHPDWRELSDYRQNKIREYVSLQTWNLLRSLEARNLVLLVREDEKQHLVKEVRLRVKPDEVEQRVAGGVPLCPECGLPVGEYTGRQYGGCCSSKCEIAKNSRSEVKQ